MKKFFYPAIRLAVVGLLLVLLQGCLKDKMTHTYTLLRPVYQTKEAVKANIKSNPPKDIQSPGKIFIYGNYIFLNEIDKGVHVIDNSDPSHPVAKAFIDIPGNVDIAVKGTTLYADMYGDLITVDIADPLHAGLLNDLPNVFPERIYANGFVADNGRLIVDWLKKDTTVEEELQQNVPVNYLLFAAADVKFFSGPTALSAPGLSGSMARFSLVNNCLYTVDHHTLKTFSLAAAAVPVLASTVNAGWDIETIYPLKDKLFLGSMGGMFVFDISNPLNPALQSNFVHARACDPVVADDHYAYITLRAGTTCGASKNELQIVDINNVLSPSLYKTVAMINPHGLSKDGDVLFVCDGTAGLKVYDARNPAALQLVKQVTDGETYDVIAWNKNALVVTKDGLWQYDYSHLNNIQLRSKINVSR